MKITVYYKTGCPWAEEVMDFLDEHELRYDMKDILAEPEYKEEVERKSGQSKSPTVEIDGEMVPDAGVEDVARHLESHGCRV